MKQLIRDSGAAMIILLTSLTTAVAQGSNVTIFLKDSSKVSGELIGVHSSVIIVLPMSNAEKAQQIAVPNDQILSVFIGGSSKTPEAIVIGGFLGSVAGALTENGLKQSLSSVGGGIGTSSEGFYSKAGFAIGAGLGWLVGWAASQPDRSFDPRFPEQLATLRTYSRHATTADSSEQRRWEHILHRVFQ